MITPGIIKLELPTRDVVELSKNPQEVKHAANPVTIVSSVTKAKDVVFLPPAHSDCKMVAELKSAAHLKLVIYHLIRLKQTKTGLF